MKDYIHLKWGSIKEICYPSESVAAAYRRYRESGTHTRSAMFHEDSPAQTAALCDLIDAVAAVGGDIVDEWTMKHLTAEEAKRYVMDGGEASEEVRRAEKIGRNIMRALLKKDDG